MWLERLEIRNYRCFHDVAVELGSLTLIVGRNNAGKSALLQAVDELFAKTIETSHQSGEARIIGTFRLTDDETAPLREHATALDPEEPWRVKREARGLPGHLKAQPWTLLVRTRSGNPIEKPFPRASLEGLPAQRLAPHLDGVVKAFSERRFHFDPVRPGSAMVDSNATADELMVPSGENLARALSYVFSQEHPAADQIREMVETLVPDAGRLLAPRERNKLQVAFKDPFTQVNRSIKELGTGVEQVVMTAYAGFRHDSGALLMLEEPEAHLHAGAQRQLAEYLAEWGTRHQILVATHSTIFMDARGPVRPRILLVERTDGVSTVRGIDSEHAPVLDALGVRLSDVLSAERVLVVEGPSDRAILDTWFGPELRRRGVTVVVAAGGDLSFQADKLVEWVDALDALKRPVLFLRDRDELSPVDVARLEKKGVRLLRVREMENHLCDPTALCTELKGKSDEELRSELRLAADALRPTVHVKRVIARLAPQRLVDRELAGEVLKSGGDLVALERELADRRRALDEVPGRSKELWAEVEAELNAEWEDGWLRIAPGEEMLKAVYSKHGRGFDKMDDGPKLAALVPAPDSLRAIIETL